MEINRDTSYIIGLAQADGHLQESSRNRGKFSIELSAKDRDVIKKIASFIPYNYSIYSRKRKTNFTHDTECDFIGIRVCNLEFRQWLEMVGVPCGRKSKIICPPTHLANLSIPDYVRGLWDGDGSVGITAYGLPFLSFTTQSNAIREFVGSFINQCCSNELHHFYQPKRDDIYNIMVTREDAIVLANVIYPRGCLAISRKYEKAQQVKKWVRPQHCKKVCFSRKKWSDVEDEYILVHDIKNSVRELNRTKSSVQTRLWRLQNAGTR